jgi:ABC-2 type transport system ATP-binding protein
MEWDSASGVSLWEGRLGKTGRKGCAVWESVHVAVQVENLTKYYGQLLAVDHVSFSVWQGEFFGFLGPNGAGKTTTVRMLTGIMKGNEGNAWVMGHPAGSVAAKQVSGVVPELSNAYLELSGWGNLMLMAELYRVPKAQAKARGEHLLHVLGLYDRKDSLAKTYSMGMRRRLIVAAALLSDPEILFLDEPTSGLDVQSARSVRGFLRELKQGGKTIFLTTHNMDEAAEMCDRVGIINRGKLVALDSPDNLRITAGKVCLVDVSFDKPISDAALVTLPGVNRVERAQAIEAAERMRLGPSAGMPEREMADKIGDNRVRLYTEDPTQLVTSMVDFSRAHSLQMRILHVRSPSLEDAFVRLTEEAGDET